MSGNGGSFRLAANNGQQDKILQFNSRLLKRLEKIAQQNARTRQEIKANGGLENDIRKIPRRASVNDIEKTHVLFTYARFKPMVPVASQYVSVSVSAGSSVLGSKVDFKIGDAGDFLGDLVLHVVIEQPTLTSTATDASNEPAMRWCDFPGERIIKRATFSISGSSMDSYTSHSMQMHHNFCVHENQIKSWERCMGQEEPQKGFYEQPNWENNGQSPSSHRVQATVHTGLQTPSPQKTEDVELWIPLLFWFCQDVRVALPAAVLANTDRRVTIELAPAYEMVGLVARGAATSAAPQGSLSKPSVTTLELFANSLYTLKEVVDVFLARMGFTLVRVHLESEQEFSSATQSIQPNGLKWPVEQMIVGVKMRAYHNVSGDGAEARDSLGRWHLWHKATETRYDAGALKSVREEALVSDGVGAVSATGVTALGVATGVNTTFTTNLAVGDLISYLGSIYNVTAVTDDTTITISPAPAVALGAATAAQLRKVSYAAPTVLANSVEPTITKLGVSAFGHALFPNTSTSFYQSYTPQAYSNSKITSPEDPGLMILPFNLYPMEYQPSGYLNLSRAQNLQFDFTSLPVSNSTSGTLVVCSQAMNFLLVTDGSAVLRFST